MFCNLYKLTDARIAVKKGGGRYFHARRADVFSGNVERRKNEAIDLHIRPEDVIMIPEAGNDPYA